MNRINSIGKIILFGIVFGVLFHLLLVGHAYYRVKSAIKESSIRTIIFKNDPSIGMLFTFKDGAPASQQRELNTTFTWRYLVNLNVLDWTTTPDNISKELKAAIDATLSVSSIKETSTLQHLVAVSQRLAMGAGDPNVDENLVNLIAANLAHGPHSLEYYRSLVESESQSFSYWENPLAFLSPRELSFLWGDKSSQGDIINLLFIHTKLAPGFDNLPAYTEKYKNDNALEPAQVFQQINEYFQRLLLSIHDDPNVISRKNWLTIVEGPEQFLMYCVFGVGLIILIQHYRAADIGDKNKRFTMTMYKWIQIALPSLGFIGTKRGLSEALGRADSIVRAESSINQSLAVSHVSETMGVAFTSTLVGLVLLMLLMIFELFLKYKHEGWNE